MVVWEVFDGNEYECAFPTKREAINAARQINTDADGYLARVTRVEIGPLTRSTVCSLINGEGYALSQRVVYPPIAVREGISRWSGPVANATHRMDG